MTNYIKVNKMKLKNDHQLLKTKTQDILLWKRERERDEREMVDYEMNILINLPISWSIIYQYEIDIDALKEYYLF